MLEGPALLVLQAWLALSFLFVGVGSLVRHALRSPARGASDLLLSVWLGWVTVLFVLQLWHLAFPVHWSALAILSVVATLGHILAGPRPWKALARGAMRHAPALVALAMMTVWLADRAVFRLVNGDSGLYHVPTIEWFTAYPIVPGLGNLHVRYGFNQSYFLYAALIDAGPFAHRTAHIANGVLVLACAARCLLAAERLVLWRHSATTTDLTYALFLPALVGLGFDVNLSNPSPEPPLFCLALVLGGQLVELAVERKPRASRDFDLVSLAILCAGALTVKLSIAALAGTCLLTGALLWTWRERPSRQRALSLVARVAVVAAVGVAPWMIRSVVLTGYPLFPSTAFGLPVAWRLPVESIDELNRPVLYWHLVGIEWWQATRDMPWLTRTLESLGWVSRDYALLKVALVAMATLAVLGLLRIVRRRAPARDVPAIVLVAPLTSLLFVFSTAPFARYAGASLWLLAAQSAALVVDEVRALAGRPALVLAGVGAVWLATHLLGQQDLRLQRLADFALVGAPQVKTVKLASGLVVRHAEATQCCWDAPLPCTPTIEPALSLRRPGDLRSGFVVASRLSQPAQVVEEVTQPAGVAGPPKEAAASRQPPAAPVGQSGGTPAAAHLTVGPTKNVFEAEGIRIVEYSDGQVRLETTDLWKGEIRTTFSSCDYYIPAIPVLDRQLTRERAALLKKACVAVRR